MKTKPDSLHLGAWTQSQHPGTRLAHNIRYIHAATEREPETVIMQCNVPWYSWQLKLVQPEHVTLCTRCEKRLQTSQKYI
jgi:hypothetical protein